MAAFLGGNIDDAQELGSLLAKWFPNGRLPSSQNPSPDFSKTTLEPRIILPLFRRHYLLIRSLMLALRTFIFTTDHMKTPNEKGSQLMLHAQMFLMVPLAWANHCETVNMRVSLDVEFLETLAFLSLASLRTVPSPHERNWRAPPTVFLFAFASQIMGQAVSLNPGPWMKFHRERYAVLQPGWKTFTYLLRELAVELFLAVPPEQQDFPTQMLVKMLPSVVHAMSLVLAEYMDVNEDGTIEFRPLPSDPQEWTPYLTRATSLGKDPTDRKQGLLDYCDVCGSSGELKRCSRCLVGRFCSVECQREGYAEHKKVCFEGKAARSEGFLIDHIMFPGLE